MIGGAYLQVWYHKIIQTLIMFAATFPLGLALTQLFELSNQPYIPAKWLRASGLAVALFGQPDWTCMCACDCCLDFPPWRAGACCTIAGSLGSVSR